MREIKFRVWNSFFKRMEYLPDLFWFAEDGGVRSIPEPGDDINFFMQYTGLKDKNGKEIYEGDIIISDWNEVTEEIKDIRSVDWLLSDGFLAGQENDGRLSGAEVVGNIYENPELIKSEKQ